MKPRSDSSDGKKRTSEYSKAENAPDIAPRQKRNNTANAREQAEKGHGGKGPKGKSGTPKGERHHGEQKRVE